MKRARGTFWTRAGILLLAVVFGVLVYWSVGFLLNDIAVFKRPDLKDYEDKQVDASSRDRIEALEEQLKDLDHRHTVLNQQRGFIKDSSSSLKITVDNLFRLKDRDQQLITKGQFDQVLACLDKIIAIQADFKTTADEYIEITNKKHSVSKEIAALKRQLEDQRAEARRLYNAALHRQRIKTTILRMCLLVPLVVFCTVVFVKKRASIYRLIYASTAIAMYLKTVAFMHESFPTRYFKYIVTVCLLALVGWGFVWLIRHLVKPKLASLLKQYRQAYERFLCPVCEYPIRTGPRKYLYWTRRTVHKTALSGPAASADHEEQPYACPSCGTQLYEKCDACGAVRHSLLPSCSSCGAEKAIDGDKF